MKSKINLVFIFLILACGGRSVPDLEKEYLNNGKLFFEIANLFLDQKEITWIVINVGTEESCEYINGWKKCPNYKNKWETFDIEKREKIYLDSISDVLLHEKINPQAYKFYTDFLIKHQIRSIGCGFDIYGESVEFEFLRNGLMYIKDKKYTLEIDSEFLYVNKINENWYSYHKDWN